ncbi:hypothetical protein D3C72_1396530 [compost metagenome]
MLDGYLRTFRDDGVEGFMQCDATTATLARGPGPQRLAPSRLLRSKLQYLGMTRMLLQHCQPPGHRILSGRMRQLIDKAFGRKGVVRGTHGPPPLHRNADLGRGMQIYHEVGDLIGKIGRPFNRRRINAVLYRPTEWRRCTGD